jgi:hypothetical protein
MSYPELKFVSIMFMFVLLAWSLFWILYSLNSLRKTTDKRIYWQTHIVWSLINVIIAGYSLISTRLVETFTYDRAVSLRNIVAVNIFLDVVYIVLAIFLQKSKSTNKQNIGRAIFIQGIFLLLLDTAIVVTFLVIMA